MDSTLKWVRWVGVVSRLKRVVKVWFGSEENLLLGLQQVLLSLNHLVGGEVYNILKIILLDVKVWRFNRGRGGGNYLMFVWH